VSPSSDDLHDPRVPRDLVTEIDAELVEARARKAWDDVRVRALEELLETVRDVGRELDRTVTLNDLIATAPTAVERNRRERLLHVLHAR
jgi:hypothetical protein